MHGLVSINYDNKANTELLIAEDVRKWAVARTRHCSGDDVQDRPVCSKWLLIRLTAERSKDRMELDDRHLLEDPR